MPVPWNQTRLKLNPGVERLRAESDWQLRELWGEVQADLTFAFVWAGRGRLQVDGQPFALRPGTLVIARPGHTYSIEQDAGHRLGVTLIHFDLLDADGSRVRREADLPSHVREVADMSYVDAVTRRVVELARGERPPERGADEQRDFNVATQLFAALVRDLDEEQQRMVSDPPPGTERRHVEVVSEAATRMNESPEDAPSLDELSHRAGYTKDHFARVFKKVMGQTPQDYLISARVRRARQLLVQSNLSIKEIASALGYRDVYFFSRQFKSKMGMTPSEARKRGLSTQ